MAPLPCEACAAGQGVPPPPGKACWARRGIAANRLRRGAAVAVRGVALPPWAMRAIHAPAQGVRRIRATRGAAEIAAVACRSWRTVFRERVCVRALSSTAAAFPRKGESPSDPLAPWPGATRAALSGTVPGGLSFELERGGALRARNHRPAAGRGPHDRPFPARPSPSWPGQSCPGRLPVAYPRCRSGRRHELVKCASQENFRAVLPAALEAAAAAAAAPRRAPGTLIAIIPTLHLLYTVTHHCYPPSAAAAAGSVTLRSNYQQCNCT